MPLAMIVLVAALYSNALPNPFLLQDRKAIVTQPDVTEPVGLWRLGHDHLGQTWSSAHAAGKDGGVHLYQPITVLSYHLNAALTNHLNQRLLLPPGQPGAVGAIGVLAAQHEV